MHASRPTVKPRLTSAAIAESALVACSCASVQPPANVPPDDNRLAYPGRTWERITAPEDVGWSAEKLRAAREYSATIDTDAVIIVVHGKILDEWGETARKFNVHSVPKSLLSALYGIQVHAGRINLQESLEQLGIDDNEPSLGAVEKRATVRDLLRA